jgi:hypothetical protein
MVLVNADPGVLVKIFKCLQLCQKVLKIILLFEEQEQII